AVEDVVDLLGLVVQVGPARRARRDLHVLDAAQAPGRVHAVDELRPPAAAGAADQAFDQAEAVTAVDDGPVADGRRDPGRPSDGGAFHAGSPWVVAVTVAGVVQVRSASRTTPSGTWVRTRPSSVCGRPRASSRTMSMRPGSGER